MDGRTDPVTDAALEQEVEALLSVQPSPEFVARVRSRVAEEPESSGWRWRWPIAAVATAMTLVVVGVMLWRPTERAAPSASTPPNHAAVDDTAPVVALPRDEPVVAHVGPPTRVVVPRSIDIALPAVMIAENETRAFAVLVTTAPRTQFDFIPPVAPSPGPLAVDKMPKMDPVVIDPIVIKPLAGETAE